LRWTFYANRGDSCPQVFVKDVSLKLAEGSLSRFQDTLFYKDAVSG
jgi:hypothetical protein